MIYVDMTSVVVAYNTILYQPVCVCMCDAAYVGGLRLPRYGRVLIFF